jgi:hypothetical protein
VFDELLDLLHAQGELIGNGVLVRGGVAFGDIEWEQDRVFGPGFIEAYEMESKFAVYPRIAVSPSLLRAFADGSLPFVHHHNLAEEARSVREIVAQSDDGVWFVDYLRAFRSEIDPSDYPGYLRNHRSLILNLADLLKKSGAGLSSLALKANWLAKYHNAVIAELDQCWFTEFCVRCDDLMVSGDLLPTLFSFDGIARTASFRSTRTRARPTLMTFSPLSLSHLPATNLVGHARESIVRRRVVPSRSRCATSRSRTQLSR